MAEIAFDVLGKIGEILVDPIVRQFSYLFCYKSNIKNLSNQLEDLEIVRDDVQLNVDAAKRNLEIIWQEVQGWLDGVDGFKSEARGVLEGKPKVENGCSNGWWNLKDRYLLSRKAKTTTESIVDHRGKRGQFFKVSDPRLPTGMTSTSSTEPFKGFKSRMSIMKKVMEALKNDEISIIGISGMAGVGKTTIVEEVRKTAKEKNLFDEVVMSVVSQNKNLIKIQEELAKMLGLTLEDTNINARAGRLRERLTSGGKILVVLDDVWESIELEEVGIPVSGDCSGCKVLITSRMERVCHGMRAQKSIIVGVMFEEEAWDLFRKMAGSCVEDEDLHDIAKEVAKECGGLPLAIVTLAKALREMKRSSWEDALGQLRKSTVTNILGMHDKVYSSIEMSCNFLGSRLPQALPLLLLCSQFPEDYEIEIERFVRYVVGLQTLEDVETMEEARNRVEALVEHLTGCSLLQEINYPHAVRMHDVVRDVCLSIASKVEEARSRVYTHMVEFDEPCTAVSPMPDAVDYPKLKLLVLKVKNVSNSESINFPLEMKELRVLDYRHSNFFPLRPSLQFLVNLRALTLESAGCLGKLPGIGCLKNLEIFSLYNSVLEEFPCEIQQLSNLKLLDLRWRRGPTIIPCGVLSALNQLEELYLGKYNSWRGHGKNKESDCAAITELNSMCNLTTLAIEVSADPMLLLDLQYSLFERLKRFRISAKWERNNYQLNGKEVKVRRVGMSWVVDAKIRSLVRSTECIDLCLIDETNLFLKEFVNLKRLDIRGCDDVESVIDAMDSGGSALESVNIDGMHRLQEVRLHSVPAMRHFWRGPIQPPSLGQLRVIRIENCGDAMKSLFVHAVAECLVQLQELEIESCDALEGIVSMEGEDNKGSSKTINLFPKLNFLRLASLSKFQSFYTGLDIVGSAEHNQDDTIQTLLNQLVMLPSMEELALEGLNHLKKIVDCQTHAISTSKLRVIDVQDCVSMEAVFDFEGLQVTGEHAHVTLDKLEEIKLCSLQKLTHIWRLVPKGIQGFQGLRSLQVKGCGRLRYLLSSSTAKMLLNLEELVLEKCRTMREVLEMEMGDCVEIVDKIVFPRLSILKLVSLKRLTSFCSQGHDLEFPSLLEVTIIKGYNMKTFCSGQISTPKLEGVQVGKDRCVWMRDLNDTVRHIKERFDRGDDD